MYLVTPDGRHFLRMFDRETANRLADNINGSIISTIRPEKIVVDIDGVHIAMFPFDKGVEYAKANKMEYTSTYADIIHKNCFMVCDNGEVLLKVEKNDFLEIKRIKHCP